MHCEWVVAYALYTLNSFYIFRAICQRHGMRDNIKCCPMWYAFLSHAWTTFVQLPSGDGLAEWLALRTHNPKVRGSNPGHLAKNFAGEFAIPVSSSWWAAILDGRRKKIHWEGCRVGPPSQQIGRCNVSLPEIRLPRLGPRVSNSALFHRWREKRLRKSCVKRCVVSWPMKQWSPLKMVPWKSAEGYSECLAEHLGRE